MHGMHSVLARAETCHALPLHDACHTISSTAL